MRDLDYRDIPRLPTWKQEEIERKVVDLLLEHDIHTIPIDPMLLEQPTKIFACYKAV